MQIIRLLLTFCLMVGVTLILSSCAPPAKEEAPPATVEEEAVEEEVTEEAEEEAVEEAEEEAEEETEEETEEEVE
jgi:hypothetical protein